MAELSVKSFQGYVRMRLRQMDEEKAAFESSAERMIQFLRDHPTPADLEELAQQDVDPEIADADNNHGQGPIDLDETIRSIARLCGELDEHAARIAGTK